MKRLNFRRRRWFFVRHRASALKVLRRNKQEGLVSIIPAGSPTWQARQTSATMRMPSVLSFGKNASETVACLDRIRVRLLTPMRGSRLGPKLSKHKAARVRQGTPYFRFEDIKEIAPSAALVLAAEFERSMRFAGRAPNIVNITEWEPSVLATFFDIGFFEIVGHLGEIEKPDLSLDFAILPMRSGDTADGAAVSELIDDLRALYPDRQESGDGLVHLYGAMVEGVVNVIRHAYPAGAAFRFRPLRRWWMTGSVDRSAGWTTAVIYDQGVTIPVSLPNWEQYASWTRRFQSVFGMVPASDDPKSDGSAIAIALEEAVSSTNDPHRGNGLAQMRSFVLGCKAGYLRIMSRCGEVIFYADGSQVVVTHNVSIGGTLIEWSVLI